MVASGLSPGFAALVLEVSSWRWVYLVLVPIVAFGLIGAKLYLEETAEAKSDSPLDLLGVLMGSASVFLVVLGTLQGRSWGWLSLHGCLLCRHGAPASVIPPSVIETSRALV